jgi:hypothetical protein
MTFGWTKDSGNGRSGIAGCTRRAAACPDRGDQRAEIGDQKSGGVGKMLGGMIKDPSKFLLTSDF